MSLPWFIARRYLGSARRSGFLSFLTGMAVGGVMLGTAALIVTLSVLDGFEREIKEKVVEFTSHVEVIGFQNQPLPDYRRSMEILRSSIPSIRSIAPFASREGMIKTRAGVDGVFLKGIDPTLPQAAARHRITAGTFLAPEGREAEIVVGRTLASRLGAEVGQKVVVFALRPEEAGRGQPRAMQFQLAGIYESGMAEFDDAFAYCRLADAQKLFQMGDRVSGFDILLTDIGQSDSVAARAAGLLGYPHHARSVFQLYRNLFSWVELQKKMSPILLFLIMFVATVNIVGTLLMFVLEKTRAVGTLKSLGGGPGLLREIFRLQGLVIAGTGILLGNALAYALCWVQYTFHPLSLPSDIYYMTTVPILLRWENFLFVTLLAFLLSIVTTVLPARAAARLDVVRALRFG